MDILTRKHHIEASHDSLVCQNIDEGSDCGCVLFNVGTVKPFLNKYTNSQNQISYIFSFQTLEPKV
jgi:hypothetical protein